MANFYWRIFQTFSNLWTSAFLRMLFAQFHSCLRTCCLDRSLAIWLRRTWCEEERCAADRTRAFSIQSPPDLIWIFLTVNPKLSPWTRLGNDRFKHSARHRLGGGLDTWIPEMLEYQWPFPLGINIYQHWVQKRMVSNLTWGNICGFLHGFLHGFLGLRKMTRIRWV